MRNKQQILQEVHELEQVKAAYLHYLCSAEAQLHVENATAVKTNKIVISNSLHGLYLELQQAKPASFSPLASKSGYRSYHYTKTESNAIMHFNRDKRFTITE